MIKYTVEEVRAWFWRLSVKEFKNRYTEFQRMSLPDSLWDWLWKGTSDTELSEQEWLFITDEINKAGWTL